MAHFSKKSAPRNYVPGLGRGASGFVTRSDIGSSEGASASEASGGSRAAEQRAAKLQAQRMQQKQTTPFGEAPSGYVAGAGRGAGKMGETANEGPSGTYDSFGGYQERPQEDEGQYDDDDDEADKIWAAIDERMNNKRKRKAATDISKEDAGASSRSRIGAQFRELKEKLSEVTEDEWSQIPDVGDYSLKFKQKQREDTFTPLTDSLLDQRSKINLDASAGTTNVTSTAAASDGTESGFKSVVTNMSGLGAARGTVLGMSLDKMSDSVSGQTVVDPKGYLTSLSNTKIATTAEVGDINKARLLLKSVRDTNPKHGPGWIASARVEEAAGNTLQARTRHGRYVGQSITVGTVRNRVVPSAE